MTTTNAKTSKSTTTGAKTAKARTVRTTKTPEQRREEADALQARIVAQVEALATSEAWTAFLIGAAAFHRYSFSNLLLILSQRPDATQVAGYRKWLSLGRQVRKGETGIRIFAGRDVKVTEKDEATGDETTKRGKKFFPVSVFDISQTDLVDPDGMDPATAAEQVVQRLAGDDEAGIFGAVSDFLTGRGWTVEREVIGGGVNGFTTLDGTKRVVVEAGLSDAHAAKTGLHETAHVLLHAEQDPSAYSHRGTAEVEAESVAYVTAGLLGMDTTAYSVGYVAGWAKGDLDVIRATAVRVLGAVHTIADALTGTEDADADEQDEEAA